MNQIENYPIRQSKETKHFFRIRKVWDIGDKAIDRYTVTFDIYDAQTGKWVPFSEGVNVNDIPNSSSYDRIYCLCMNAAPFHPQGFGQSGTCTEGRHLGKRISFQQLPEDCKKCCYQYMEG